MGKNRNEVRTGRRRKAAPHQAAAVVNAKPGIGAILLRPRGLPEATPRQPRSRATSRAGIALVLAGLALPPLLAFVLYAGTLNGPFVFDDHNTITYATAVRQLHPLSRFLALDRPLTNLSFAINYALGGLNPRGYHAVSIVLHALAGLLACLLGYQTLRFAAALPASPRLRFAVALFCALAFVAHPLQTESVAYVSSRSEVLTACFILLTVLLFAFAVTAKRRPARVLSASLLPLATAAALASKEVAAMLPFVLILYDWCFLVRVDRRRLNLHWKPVALSLLPFLLAAPRIAHLAFSAKTAGFGFDRFSALQYTLTQFGVILHYLRLAIAPLNLCFDYDWPLASSPWTPGVVVPFILLTALAVAAVKQRKRRPLITFAVLWTFLLLAPTSSIVPLADLAVERRMYLAMFGWTLLGAAAIYELIRYALRRLRVRDSATFFLFAVVALLLLSWYSLLTARRTHTWSDRVALYEDGVAKAPTNPRAHLNLGATYINEKRLDDAWPELLEAKRLYDRHESIHAFRRVGAFIHYNLGVVALARGQVDNAERYLMRTLELGGRFVGLRPLTYMYLGHIAGSRDNWPTAVARYEEALRTAMTDVRWRIRLDLARALIAVGKNQEAREHLREILRHEPGNQRAQTLLRQIRAPIP